MMMTINVHALEAGSTLKMRPRESEVAVVLIQGHVQMNGHNARRDSCIDDPGYCLHLCRDSVVEIKAEADSEILIQTTPNPRAFPGLIYNPANTRRETFGQGQFEGKALRTVTTFFDYETAPYSNMVCGEILIPQGGWSSYPPHEHPQPEVYYYRFGHPAGFGACFIDDNAYVIKDRSFAAIPGGKYHPQVNAPGYPMMYVWMIRHFEGYPWTERNFQPEHQWLLEE
ncbi:MAG: 5-deoxy-glucuronate isomerase [Oscillospiraceae bacterium]|nr:5-deoxy-glucuronate isomerase [Oscillospiraceae bacterium]